ncbi:MAG: hypothetical protein AB7I42_24165 [Bradyrhizobium sp.]|uniref:hypothetical protein n=1 Tax=Bradyrhizobium sp. TaxID=376 RepID=UPI003D0B0CC0
MPKPPRNPPAKDLPKLPPDPIPNPEEVRAALTLKLQAARAIFWKVVISACEECRCMNRFRDRERVITEELRLRADAGPKAGGWGYLARVEACVEYWGLIGPAFDRHWSAAIGSVVLDAPKQIMTKLEAAAVAQVALGADAMKDLKAVPYHEGVKIVPAASAPVELRIRVREGATEDDKVDIRGDLQWVYQNMDRALREEVVAPSVGAAAMIRTAMVYRREFYERFISVFGKETEEDRGRVTDDGRREIALLQEVRTAAVRARQRRDGVMPAVERNGGY